MVLILSLAEIQNLELQKKAGTNATPEHYAEVLAKEKELWKKDYEEVKACGGLYVIGSERHESRRIDNQLRGRSGRQGDPGRSKFFISLDDDLMRLFGGERMKAMMSRIGMEQDVAIDHPWLNKGIERAQTKVEERNFEIRKHLLDYDDVLNQQRNEIYAQRDAILSDEDLSNRVLTNAVDAVEDFVNDYVDNYRKNQDEAYSELIENLKQTFAMSFDIEDLLKNPKSKDEIVEKIVDTLKKDLAEKESLVGKKNMNMFIRYQYIQNIDKKWLDHLETLESLRDAVSLRTYSQKNPLTEYKLDGFNIYYDMLDSIRLDIVSKVFRVKIQTGETALRNAKGPREMNAQHNAMQAFDGNAARARADASPMASRRQGDNVQVVRTVPKVGRNDPCPCGSGKKYKQCCGR